jgi:hypothetical protein
MPNALQQAGAAAEPSNFAPLNTDRMFTGLWSNRNPLRDAATSNNEEKYYGARQDSILGGYNSEISSKLTLRRRPGTVVYNYNNFAPINRFYAFNTFSLTSEFIVVLADTATQVLNVTDGGNQAIWNKSSGALSTYFLGVGNILYFTNGVENKQWDYNTNTVSDWGIAAPTNAPSVSLPTFTAYGAWLPSTVFSRTVQQAKVVILDPNGNIQVCTLFGNTGTASSISWNTASLGGTSDGGVEWQNRGNGLWTANTGISGWDLLYHQSTDGNNYFYFAVNNGTSAGGPPTWLPGIGSITQDNDVQWQNIGRLMQRADIGDDTPIVGTDTIEDSSGNIQSCVQAGRTGATAPNFSSIQSALTSDPTGNAEGAAIWQNAGAVAPIQYGYAYMNDNTDDISNMSPASVTISANDGHPVVVQGVGSADPQVTSVVIFRTLHGGSTFLYATKIANPGGGQPWAFTDSILDANLNISWQAQVNGEGTPLPIGATCMEYHLGRIFAAVGNVVYASSGPDAAASGSSGNAGFDTTFTCQSKITRFWVTSIGLIVFTVRDSYIILGDGVNVQLYMIRYIPRIPLLSYDCFTEFLTTGYMMMGNKTVISLDPSSGVVEVGQPIADLLNAYNPKTSYVTFHSQESGDTALYVADGAVGWYRLAPTSAPESGSNWSPQAQLAAGTSAVQSVELSPGYFGLLIGPPTGGGPILARELTVNTDAGMTYPVKTRFGSVVVAQPGELAGLAWMTLEAAMEGSAPSFSVMLSEVNPVPNGSDFENVPRTRQDPPNLPPSQSLYSNRHSLMQNQTPTWCRHFQFEIDWPAEDAANELLTFTIFGQMWQEMRSQ